MGGRDGVSALLRVARRRRRRRSGKGDSREFANKELSRLLVATDLAKGDSSGLVAARAHQNKASAISQPVDDDGAISPASTPPPAVERGAHDDWE